MSIDDDQTEAVIDKAALETQILAGAKAFGELLHRVGDDWMRWQITIVGLRGLRDLARARAHTMDIQSYAYRQEMSALLQLRKYSVYDQIDKPTRSACYQIMDSLDEISAWYYALPSSEKLQWKHPRSIAKHAPRHLVEGGKGHNKPRRKRTKPASSPEVERLKVLLVQVIKRLLKYEPEAAELLDQISPADPNDKLDDL
jgi:hypothetical protein